MPLEETAIMCFLPSARIIPSLPIQIFPNHEKRHSRALKLPSKSSDRKQNKTKQTHLGFFWIDSWGQSVIAMWICKVTSAGNSWKEILMLHCTLRVWALGKPLNITTAGNSGFMQSYFIFLSCRLCRLWENWGGDVVKVWHINVLTNKHTPVAKTCTGNSLLIGKSRLRYISS